MLKSLKLVLLAAALALASCGGGSGCGGKGGTSPFSECSADEPTTDTPTGSTPVAADMSIVLSKTVVNNSGTDTVTVSVTAVDKSRNAVSGIPVAFSVNASAIVAAGGNATDDKGTLQATVSIGADKSNRVVTVTATSGSLTRSASFVVTGAKLSATALPVVTTPGSSGNKVRFVLQDINDNPIGNQPIEVTAPGLAALQGVTAADGTFEYGYVGFATPNKYRISAAAAGVTASAEVEVQATGGSSTRDPVSVPILSASVSANPSVVGVNEAGSQLRSTRIRALFLGANNAPIKDVRVRFDLAGDPNSIGGTFSTGTNVTFSEADGVAVADYFPGSRSSPTNGVTVRACYGPTDASLANNACPFSATATLTVTAEPLSVSIGTDNTISNGAGGLTYIKRYVVMVVDSSGQAISNVQVTPSIDILRYYKGGWAPPPAGQTECSPGGPLPNDQGLCQFSGATQGDVDPLTRSNLGCLNEDVNRNGVLETQGGLGPGGTEDFNGNGVLDPRKSDISIRTVGSNRTDDSGIVIVQIEYPENVATWLRFSILVSASGVSGTEGRARWEGVTSALDSDFDNPAFGRSPYGTSNDCSNKE